MKCAWLAVGGISKLQEGTLNVTVIADTQLHQNTQLGNTCSRKRDVTVACSDWYISDVATCQLRHVVVYTRSSLVEQTTPAFFEAVGLDTMLRRNLTLQRGRASTTARKGVNYSAEGRQLQRGRASTTARKGVNYSAEGRQLQRGRASTTARKGVNYSADSKGVNYSAQGRQLQRGFEGRQLQRGRASTTARKGVNYSAEGRQLQRGRVSTTARKGVNYSAEGRQLQRGRASTTARKGVNYSAEGRQLQRGRASTTARKGVNYSAEGRQLQRGRASTTARKGVNYSAEDESDLQTFFVFRACVSSRVTALITPLCRFPTRSRRFRTFALRIWISIRSRLVAGQHMTWILATH